MEVSFFNEIKCPECGCAPVNFIDWEMGDEEYFTDEDDNLYVKQLGQCECERWYRVTYLLTPVKMEKEDRWNR